MTKVKILVRNRVAILERPYPSDKLLPYWSHAVSSYGYMLKSRPWYRKCRNCKRLPSQHDDKRCKYEPIWDGKVKFLKRDRVPAGLFWATYKDIEQKERIKFKIRVDIQHPKLKKERKWLISEGKYEFQNQCADKIVKAIIKGKGGLVINATGSGKTRTAAMVASRINCDFCFIVDQLNLLRQAQKDIEQHLGEKVGFVGESKFKTRRFTVATRQTLAAHIKDPKFIKWYEGVDVFFVDEIHEQMNKSNFDVLNAAKPLSVIGLTATLALTKKPVRMKAYSIAGEVLYEYPLTRGMQEGVLSKGIVVQILYNNSVEGLRRYTAEENYKKRVVRNNERNWLIGKLVSRANKVGKYTLVLVDRLKHLSDLSYRLDDIPHRIMAGSFRGKKLEISKRMIHQAKFEEGKFRVILANKVFKKGVDVKRLDLIINATGRKGKEDAIQVFGRGIRQHDDKQGLLLLDICDVDNYDDTRKKKNWVASASKSRRRAYRKHGITVKQVVWEEDTPIREFTKELFKQSQQWLDKEGNNG